MEIMQVIWKADAPYYFQFYLKRITGTEKVAAFHSYDFIITFS